MAHHPLCASALRQQRGAGLIEVLVSVFILSLGLLGMASLQAGALKTNQSSHARSQAVMLSYYMLDAMRADRDNALLGSYNTDTSATPGAALAAICSATEVPQNTLADNAREDWINSLKNSLGNEPATCGAIRCEATGECAVQITWDDSRAGGLGAQRFETRSRL